jgi:hypothetical protein
MAAIESKRGFLVTGDKSCFGDFYGHTLEGVAVLAPAAFLRVMIDMTSSIKKLGRLL